MRTFVGISLPHELATALADWVSEAAIGHPVPIENLHLTLAIHSLADRCPLRRNGIFASGQLCKL